MTVADFIYLPMLAFAGNFLFGYIMLSVFAFVRKSVW